MPNPGFLVARYVMTRGEIWIPMLSVLVARLDAPVLVRRREDAEPELVRYDLHAAYSYFNRDLWEDPDFEKEITVFLGKKPLKVATYEKTTTVFLPGALRMEGVTWHEA